MILLFAVACAAGLFAFAYRDHPGGPVEAFRSLLDRVRQERLQSASAPRPPGLDFPAMSEGTGRVAPDESPSTPLRRDWVRATDRQVVWALTDWGLGLPERDEYAEVAFAHPPDWRYEGGQFFDARGNKVAEFAPGPFRFPAGGACAALPSDTFGDPPIEQHAFDLDGVRGLCTTYATFCEGDGRTYSGPCFSHSYCLEANRDGLAVLLSFLELSDAASPATRDVFDGVAASVALSPAR
jgi:hypothetical protein